jgi:hypothetical protein
MSSIAGNQWETISSRKIELASMKRHFATFIPRDFIIDRANYTLGMRSLDSSSKTVSCISKVELDSPTVRLQAHHYADDGKPSFSLTYLSPPNNKETEMMFQFDSIERMTSWFNVRTYMGADNSSISN